MLLGLTIMSSCSAGALVWVMVAALLERALNVGLSLGAYGWVMIVEPTTSGLARGVVGDKFVEEGAGAAGSLQASSGFMLFR
mmetsp:Transcript_48776/g.104108  ORF Transcript_48776/g.104108 Transcript_48776/m.104108 type:complete len:82 (+) Transcript_48776:315-560(+)